MSDIAERLRGYNPPDRVDQWSPVCGATLLSIARDIHDGADEIERLSAEVARLTKENDWLRAYTAQSAKDCVYCGLGADEQGKCERGFPGCARGDDQMLCREVDVALERDELRAEVVSLRKQIAALESHEVCTAAHDHTETCGYCQRDALAQDAARYRWLRTAGALRRAAHIAVLTRGGGYVAENEQADFAIDAAMREGGK